MRFPDSEAERLNCYLDARVQGRQVNPDDLDPSLVDACERVKAMDARSAPDPQLMTNLWRTMMSTIPAEIGHGPRAVAPPLPFSPRQIHRDHRTTIGGLVTALGVVALLLASAIGYQRFNGGSDPGQPTTIPAAFQEVGAPTATGCEALPRETGSIAQILETPQTRQPFMPRFGYDPVYGEAQDHQIANADFLLMNSAADDSFREPIMQALEQLVACRFYTTANDGTIDMEGRYFALYSDDYFRRELSGYEEAGMPLRFVAWWDSASLPIAVETRRITDDLVLAFLDMGHSGPGATVVIRFVNEGGRWLVDEVGFADMLIDGDASPVPPAPMTLVPGQWVDRYPLQLDVPIYDTNPCVPNNQGTPVPCGTGFGQAGPYPFTVFPANTDFTITLYNLGEQPKRFEIADLGITIELEAGGSETIVLNAETGDYPFTIFQGDRPDPISAGVFTFIPPDGPPPSMG